MVTNLGDCFAPAVNIYRRNDLQVSGVDVHADCVQGVCAWQVTDGGFFGFGGAVEAFEYPFENAAVFAIAKPHEAVVFVAAEPVDEFLQTVTCDRSGDPEVLSTYLNTGYGTRHWLVPGFLQGNPY